MLPFQRRWRKILNRPIEITQSNMMTVMARQVNERSILSMRGRCGHRTASFARSMHEVTLSSPFFRQVLLITWSTRSLSITRTCYASSLFLFFFFFIMLAFFQPCRQFMFRSQHTTFKDRFGARFKIADEGFEIYFHKSSWSHSCKMSIQLQDS